MDNSTDQLYNMANSEIHQILFGEYVYKNSNDNKNTECSTDQLII